MALPTNIILIWGGTTIPTGFTDVSSTYAGYVRMKASGDAETGLGSATHSHKAASSHIYPTAHGPAMEHTHTGGTYNYADTLHPHAHNAGNNVEDPHSHTFSLTNPTWEEPYYCTTETTAVDNDPYTYEYQLIRNASATQIPVNGLVLSRHNISTGFTKQAATGKLLSVHTYAASPARGTGVERGTADHTDVVSHHNHNWVHHHHGTGDTDSVGTAGHTAGDGTGGGGATTGQAAGGHTHPVSGPTMGATPSSTTTAVSSPTTNNLDLYPVIKLMLWKADAGTLAKKHVIALWDMASGSVPYGWQVVAGTDGDYIYLDPDGAGEHVAAASGSHLVDLTHGHGLGSHAHACPDTEASTNTVAIDVGAVTDSAPLIHGGVNTDSVGVDTGGDYLQTDIPPNTDLSADPLAPPCFKICLIELMEDDGAAPHRRGIIAA